MYGVGALDMKSGCAAIMLAVAKFAKEHQANGSFCGKLIYHLVSDEKRALRTGNRIYNQ